MSGRTTIIVPCYNEARRLNGDAFLQYARSTPDVTFCFVDDGSTDETRSVLNDLARASDAIDLCALDRNGGKADAVRRGVLHALVSAPAYVGYWDADLATPLEMIAVFRSRLESNKDLRMVIGSRVALLGHEIDRKASRHYFGRLFATAAAATLSMPVYDTQCGAKLLRVDERTAQLFDQPFCVNWMFDVELIARLKQQEGPARRAGAYLNEVPLSAWHDVAGSKVRATDGARALRELYRIYRRYHGVAR